MQTADPDSLELQSARVGISQAVKLVIWDLDDTFWQGTLSEGEVTAEPENIELVRTLAERGIVSSICSRNDFSTAEAKLRELGVWDFFVFPSMQWAPKGSAIKDLIERANLRAENVLFLDDSPTNLGDAQYHCPGIMCLTSPQRLADSMASDFLRGKPDPELTRLEHYRLLEARTAAEAATSLSNEEFLRQSEITVEIDYDVESHSDRIAELLNRTNQLNFTKRRIESEDDRQLFDRELMQFGFKAGVVKVRDRYGDYGVVGFFMTISKLKSYRYRHLAFSCRIMNMGVEQFVHEYLNEPAINIQPPVANDLHPFECVDWITEAKHEQNLTKLKQHKIVLVGGCDMLQLSSYCSAESIEFTNSAEQDLMVRYDDPHFFLSNREAVEASTLRPETPAWTAEDMASFDEHAVDTDVVLLSFYRMMGANYFRGSDGLLVRLHEQTVKDILKTDRAMWFVRNFSYVPTTFDERLELVRLSVKSIARRSQEQALIILLYENVRRLDPATGEAKRRARYNEYIADLARQIPKLHSLDVNSVTAPEWIIDGWHMSRQGYLQLAEEVMRIVDDHAASHRRSAATVNEEN